MVTIYRIVALSIVLSSASSFPSSANSFSLRTTNQFHKTSRSASVSALYNEEGNGSTRDNSISMSSLGDVVRTVKVAYIDSTDVLLGQDEEDATATTIKERKKRVVIDAMNNVPTFVYDINCPLGQKLGFYLKQVDENGVFSECALDVDSLKYISAEKDAILHKGVERMSGEEGPNGTFQIVAEDSTLTGNGGIVVSSIQRGGLAWNKGVRAGDLLLATSATLGDNMWPKSTLDGVRSAISSRKVVSSGMQFQFRRVGALQSEAEIVQEFELNLTRPMGIHIEDSQEGYVQISGFTDDAPEIVRSRLRVGDRIIAVDSSFGGTMWPVSNVEGIVSSVTTRLPGQPVQIRFERVVDEGTDFSEIESLSKAEAERQQRKATSSLEKSLLKSYSNLSRTDTSSKNTELLDRCRSVLKRYISIYDPLLDRTKDVPAVVADRVLESLSDSDVSLDANLLSLIMNAYIICNQPRKALETFFDSTGMNSDASTEMKPSATSKSHGSKKLRSNSHSLNIVTATDAVRAHSLIGDTNSCKRILAAIHGNDLVFGGIKTSDWSKYMKADTKLYNAILSALVKANDLSAIESVIKQMEPKKNLVTYNTVIAAYAKSGKRKEAFDVFKELQKVGIKPDNVSVTSLIKVVVDDGDFETARSLLKDMKKAGIKADVVSYNTIIRRLCEDYKWFEAKDLVADMESNGIEPNAKTYGLLMNGLLKLNKPGPCLTLFESAISDPKTSMMMENVQLYTTAVTAAATLGDYERAVELVQRMTFAGVKPNIKTLTALMGACITASKFDYALDFFKKISKPDGYSKILAVRSFCGKRDFQRALNIVEDDILNDRLMSGRDIVRSCNSVIESALQKKDFEYAQKAFSIIIRIGLVPSKQTFTAIIDSLDIHPKTMVSKSSNMVNSDDEIAKFKFMLAVLDELASRKLACSGNFYVGLLNHAAKVGGLCKRIGFLISDAKIDTSIQRVEIESSESNSQTEKLTISWLDLYSQYSEFKNEIGTKSLSPVKVNINQQDMRKLLLAERGVAFQQRQKVKKSSFSRL